MLRVCFYNPLKISENQMFTRGDRIRSTAWNDLYVRVLCHFPDIFGGITKCHEKLLDHYSFFFDSVTGDEVLTCFVLILQFTPVNIQRRFKVYKTSIRRRWCRLDVL